MYILSIDISINNIIPGRVHGSRLDGPESIKLAKPSGAVNRQPGSALQGRAGSGHGYRSSSSERRCAREVPAPSECRSRIRAGALRNSGEEYDNQPVL